jgi:elongation factor P
VATTADFRNGLNMRLDGQIFTLIEFQHVKPGKGAAFVRTKLKNLYNGSVVERTFRAGVKIEPVRLERRSMQYLYRDGEHFVFMDQGNYEQTFLSEDIIGDASQFLKESMKIDLLLVDKDSVGIELPIFAELKVVETDPGVKGDTASGGTKPATLETGAVITVPLFVQEGDVIKIDTRSSEYIERV